MKAGDDVEALPRCPLDGVSMNPRYFTRAIRKIGIWLDTVGIKPFTRNLQEVATRTADLEKSSGRLQLSDQVKAPARIEQSQPMFFLESKVSKILVRSEDVFGCFLGRTVPED